MSRLSREKKREHNSAGRPAAAVAPLDVHVRGGGPATIGGVPVTAADGQEIQHAVLSHLHRISLATGHSVLATVHDERIGYVVPLRVDPDGSSHFTGEPLRMPPAPEPRHDKPTHLLRQVEVRTPQPEAVPEAEPVPTPTPTPTRTPEPEPESALPAPHDAHPASLPGTVLPSGV